LIQKKQNSRPARHQKLVRNWHPYSGIKSILSRPLHVGEADMVRLASNRVSVLDLDNICSFRQADVRLAEETAAKTLASDPKALSTRPRSPPYSARSNSVDFTSRLLSKRMYLSLRCQLGVIRRMITVIQDWMAKPLA
jgi:hypothetical protein